LNQEEFRERLDIANPDVIGFTGNTRARFLVYDEIRYARQVFPKVKIVVGGAHFTPTAEEALRILPQIDVVVRGEGEITFYELIESWHNGSPLEKIDGISYRQDGRIVHNPDRKPFLRIDEFDIDEEAVKLEEGNYTHIQKLQLFPEIDAIPVLLGRGCPNKCTFCGYSNNIYRVRSLSSVIAEIENKKSRFGISAFNFIDPSLTIRENFVRNFCAEIIRRNLKIKWFCESRVDINLELLSLMKNAGCVSLSFALESGSEKVLKAICKNITFEQTLTFAQRTQALGIRSLVFTMVSLPEEKEEDAKMTLDALKKMAPYVDTSATQVLRILPGTVVEKQAYQKGILPKNFSWYDVSFKDVCNDKFAVGGIPLWFEYLTPHYIRNIWQPAYEKIFAKNFMSYSNIKRLIRMRLGITLFDWKNEGLTAKISRISYALRLLYYKIFARD